MAAASDYLEAALLDATLRATSYTSPSTVYLALYTSDPGDDNSGTECSGTITHFGVLDAATSGNLLYHGALTTSRAITSGDIFRVPTGDLDITCA